MREKVLSAPEQTISELASATGRCRKRISQLLRLSWLAPDVVDAVLEGRYASSLTAKELLESNLDLEWVQQRAALSSN